MKENQMANVAYSNKCKWCGVIVDSEKPVEVCECCGATEIVSKEFFIEGQLPKSYKEQKLAIIEAKKKKTKNIILLLGSILALTIVGALAIIL